MRVHGAIEQLCSLTLLMMTTLPSVNFQSSTHRLAEVIRSHCVSLFGHVACMETSTRACYALDHAIAHCTEGRPLSGRSG